MQNHIRKNLFSIIFSFIFFFTFSFFPRTVNAVVLQRPVQIQNVTASSADIIWKSDTVGTTEVKYGLTNSYELGTVSGINGRKTIDSAPGYLHKATITGLTANTKYYYQVLTAGVALSPAGDQTYYLKTAPPNGTAIPFNWTIWGDSGNNSSAQRSVAAQALSRKPELTLVAGDITYGSGYGGFPSLSGEPQQDQNHFDIYTALSRFSPFYLVCGNHDNNDNNTPAGIINGCDVMIDEQSMPNGGRIPQSVNANDDVIYSFDYGNVHFTVINDNPETSSAYSNPNSGSPQMLWAYQDIKSSTQPWKILVGHTNGWSSGSHTTNSNVVNGPALMAQDAGVNVMLWGHSHVYERLSRFAAQGHVGCSVIGGCRDKGPYYYTIGNGGQAGLVSACGNYTNGPECLAGSGIGSIPGGAGFLYVQANGDTLTFNYIGASGTQYDTKTMNLSEWGTVAPRIISPTATTIPTPTPSLEPTVVIPTPTALPTNIIATSTLIPSQIPTPVCPSYSTNLGAANMNINFPVSGNYKVWSRIMAKDNSSNSYFLKIDEGCPINVGDKIGMEVNTWIWLSYQIGDQFAPIVLNLSSGDHSVELIGRESGVKLDKVIFTTDLSCVPSGTGDNCLGAVTISSSPTPTAAISLPSFTISKIRVSNVGTTEATVNWTTSQPGTSIVEIQQSESNPSVIKNESLILTTKHAVTVTGLNGKTQYFFKVYSKDAEGTVHESSLYNFRTKNR